MSVVEISGRTSQTDRPPRSRAVVVVYEHNTAGAAALLHAHSLAADRRARLTVLAVASKERTDIGCGSCRQGAMFRNQIACQCATDALSEARNVVASAGPSVDVGFEVVRGPFRGAVGRAAREHDAGVIVLPALGPIRRRLSRDRVKRLEGDTAASVVVAPNRV
jgi:hypothetical protein